MPSRVPRTAKQADILGDPSMQCSGTGLLRSHFDKSLLYVTSDLLFKDNRVSSELTRMLMSDIQDSQSSGKQALISNVNLSCRPADLQRFTGRGWRDLCDDLMGERVKEEEDRGSGVLW